MTSEIRTSVDLNDVAGIEIECPQCFASVLLPVAKFRDGVPALCPNCREHLIGEVAQAQIRALIKAMALLSAPNDGLHAKVRIQVKPIAQK